MSENIRIMLVESRSHYRKNLARILRGVSNVQITGLFDNAEEAIQNIKDNKSRTDIILLGLNLFGLSGFDAIPLFNECTAGTKIIILSQSDREVDVLNAIKLGAHGYLLKSATMKELMNAIQSVSIFGAILDPSLAQFILKALQGKPSESAKDIGVSARELEVLNLVASGFSQKEIGVQLEISPFTVTDHLKNVYEKLDVKNAPAAVAKALKFGILPSV